MRSFLASSAYFQHKDLPVLEVEPAKLILDEDVPGPEEAIPFPEHVTQYFLNRGHNVVFTLLFLRNISIFITPTWYAASEMCFATAQKIIRILKRSNKSAKFQQFWAHYIFTIEYIQNVAFAGSASVAPLSLADRSRIATSQKKNRT